MFERRVIAGGRLRADLDALVAVDVVGLSDAELRSETLEFLAAANQLHAALAARVGAFDARGVAEDDACRITAVWLRSIADSRIRPRRLW